MFTSEYISEKLCAFDTRYVLPNIIEEETQQYALTRIFQFHLIVVIRGD